MLYPRQLLKNRSKHYQTYNALPEVEVAFEELKKKHAIIHKAFKEFSDISIPTLSKEQFGIFLVHKHWRLNPLEEILEQPEQIEENTQLLVSTPQQASLLPEGYVPTRWIISHDELEKSVLHPVEFSSDSAALYCYRQFQKNPEIFEAIVKIIEENGLSHLLGICIISREHFKDIDNAHIILEENVKSIGSILLKAKASKMDFSKAIPTSWSFKEAIKLGCISYCTPSSYCRSSGYCSPSSYCRSGYDSHIRESDHYRSTSHETISRHDSKHRFISPDNSRRKMLSAIVEEFN